MFYHYSNTAENTWREEAIALLQENTEAPICIISHYVDTNWPDMGDDEENLIQFEIYLESYNSIGDC